jgi:hypothetical protein
MTCGLHEKLLFVEGYCENFGGNPVPLITPTMIMETVAVSERLDTKSTLTRLITEEDFIIPSHYETLQTMHTLLFIQRPIPYFLLLSEYMKVHASV